jgi:hypothetical protein
MKERNCVSRAGLLSAAAIELWAGAKGQVSELANQFSRGGRGKPQPILKCAIISLFEFYNLQPFQVNRS